MKPVAMALVALVFVTSSVRAKDGHLVPSDPRNCYAYAIDAATPLNPGDRSGMPRLTTLDVGVLAARAEHDGLIPVGDPDDCERPCWAVALATARYDYHWYRREPDGSWSHKFGITVARPFAGDPKTAGRGAYATFGGYFCACRGKTS